MSAVHRFCLGVVLLSCLGCFAADSDFYRHFITLADTHALLWTGVTDAVLVDTNNTAPKLTNSIISLQKLRMEGEVADIGLGMTMDQVVGRWGKPFWLHPNCDGGHRFRFGDCSLVFRGDSLNKVRLQDTAVFTDGLSAKSNRDQWMKVLGQPTVRNDDNYGSALVYETRPSVRTVLLLTFDSDGDAKFPPYLYLDAPLTTWFRPSRP